MSEEKSSQIEGILNDYLKILLDEAGYLYDLEVELQNKLLGKLFNNQLARRIPKDASVVVISTDVFMKKKLEGYFNEMIDDSMGANKTIGLK